MRVGWQQRSVEIRRDAQTQQAVFPGKGEQAFCTVLAVVAVCECNAAKGSCASSELRSTCVVFEANQCAFLAGKPCIDSRVVPDGCDWRVGVERHHDPWTIRRPTPEATVSTFNRPGPGKRRPADVSYECPRFWKAPQIASNEAPPPIA